MSFFNRGSGGPPPQDSYQRLRGQPQQGYNDPSVALFSNEKKRLPQRPGQPLASGKSGAYGIVQAPDASLALTNCLIVHRSDFQTGQHVLIKGGFGLTCLQDPTGRVQAGTIGTSGFQRAWIGLSASGDETTVETLPQPPHPSAPSFIESLDLEVSFVRPNHEIPEVFSADEMTKNFVKAFSGTMFSPGQSLAFEFHGNNIKALVKGVSLHELAEEQQGHGGRRHDNMGVLMERSDVNFIKAGNSLIKIKSSARKAAPNAILAPNFKFEDMGIGGLDTEFASIFRRAFASRVFPPGLVDKLGIHHVKGLLLHGPPGTGKTLIARQIGKMLNAREPKIVNGPEILSKYVGASEENIRKLFADAEKEYKEKGDESGLHIIIFDELDAIFKQRGSTNTGTGVGDTVVNQMLSKMDGVDQLNNILIIGMTNRLDMIDEALLRPGRLEVHMEISLPDEHGRLQILNIHTAKMRNNGVMDHDVDLAELAALSKNFSGAEINGLIKSATSFAFNRHVKVGTMAGISDDVENLRVNRDDFLNALDEVHPAFGVSEEELEQLVQNGIIRYDTIVDDILQSGQLVVEQVRVSTRTPLVSMLLYGPAGSGKSALAATIAQASQFPFIKLLSPDSMVGMSEAQKVLAISKVFSDSYKSPLSVVVVDGLERLLEYNPLGPRFSNAVTQTLLVLFARRPPKGRRLLILATSSTPSFLKDIGLFEVFDSDQRVPPVSDLRSLEYILEDVRLFKTGEERRAAIQMLSSIGFASDRNDESSAKRNVGIKKLLSVIEMARQEPDSVAHRLFNSLVSLGM